MSLTPRNENLFNPRYTATKRIDCDQDTLTYNMDFQTSDRDQSVTDANSGPSVPRVPSFQSSPTLNGEIPWDRGGSSLANSVSDRVSNPSTQPYAPPWEEFRFLVSLPDGCSFPVDEDFLPLYPSVLDPAGGLCCTCQDDARAYIAAYLVAWPRFAVKYLQRSLIASQNDAMVRLESWDLVRKRLDAGLHPGVCRAVEGALERTKHKLTRRGRK
jgi:hypothetical protein